MTKTIMKLRLNMTEVKSNYKGITDSDTCDLCSEASDTTEHLFQCKEIKKRLNQVPGVEIIKKDDNNCYDELAKFLNDVYLIKEIDVKKTVKENLDKTTKIDDIYTVKTVENNGMKIILAKNLPVAAGI